jgi:two-component system, cell cycle sensor histidine kinase and response regulator CckA
LAKHFEAPFNDQRMQLLEQVTRALSAPGDVASIMRVGTSTVVPGFAHTGVLVVPGGMEDQLEVVHPVPDQAARLATRVRALLPTLRNIATRDRQHGREFRWIPVVNEASTRFLQRCPDVTQLLREFEVGSLVAVPLRSGGQVLGVMALAREGGAAPFHAADLAVAQVIARRMAVAIESAQLHERSLDQEGQRHRLEAALQKWIRVFDLAGWGAAVVDGTDRRIEAVNPAFAQVHGYTDADTLGGQLFAELLPPDRRVDLDEWFSTAANQPGPYQSLHLRADGSTFPALTSVTALELDPRTTSYVVTVQDLTELKRAEERTRWAQRMEAVGRLAGGVAHEVNNMMTIIIGFGDLLSKAELPPDRQRDIEEIRKAAARAAKITQQLLAFSRQQILQPADLDLNDVVTAIIPVLQLLLPANIRVESALSAAPAPVHADRAQLEQVLINLAFNARDAMPGGGFIRLATGSRRLDAPEGERLIGVAIPAARYALLTVSDTGSGMDSATLTHAFEPFFTTKPAGSGTGLGLATVYGIVKQSGGYVWVESTPRVGTTFTVALPQVDRPALPGATTDPAQKGDHEQSGATVLVVENEEGVRELTRRVLEGEGCRVFEARSGEDAASALERFGSEIDLVLADVILPDMGAAELERRVAESRQDTSILYMSAYSRDEIVERSLIPADRPFVQKPFTAADLIEAVWREMDARSRPVVSG